MPGMTYVLDSEALSKIALNDRAMSVTLANAHQSSVRVVTSSMTLIEAYHDRTRQLIRGWVMSWVVVESVTQHIADEAIRLLGSTGLHNHKYAIDGALAVIARRQRGRVVVITSNEDDMGKLCGAGVQVRGL